MMPIGGRLYVCPVRTQPARAVGLLSLLLVLSPITGAAEQARPQRVLMLHAFNYTFAATTIVEASARKRLIDTLGDKIDIDADFLDLARNSDPTHEPRTARYLAEKYAVSQPDVIMALGSAALPFIIRNRASIAPDVPVVFTGVSPANYASVGRQRTSPGSSANSIWTRRWTWPRASSPTRVVSSSSRARPRPTAAGNEPRRASSRDAAGGWKRAIFSDFAMPT
jgi:hypothetical protein